MAINEDDIQAFLGSDDGDRSTFRSDSGAVGRAWIDGALVVYDLEDCPQWLANALKAQDENGRTRLAEPRVAVA